MSRSISRPVQEQRAHVQRDVLTVEHVAALEEAIFKLPNVNDRVLAGLLAFLTRARARFGDVHVCDDEPFLDVDNLAVD